MDGPDGHLVLGQRVSARQPRTSEDTGGRAEKRGWGPRGPAQPQEGQLIPNVISSSGKRDVMLSR